eukprot:CAMPEP_0116064382 /NCGR_PEP_ID=MMETSP0322-20121206/9062_1 /TAXON_ID=163516 /ORGANISM="Leptocylindrus danicus var. apora, Strain B651" /LENGTH=277 /DNA_ID=CAMNT_0003550351 /DNA_START=41 /DNA_END=874 /DNA_ORIENTATION=+
MSDSRNERSRAVKKKIIIEESSDEEEFEFEDEFQEQVEAVKPEKEKEGDDNNEDDDDYFSSDDEVPLAELMRRNEKKASVEKKKKKVAATAKKKSAKTTANQKAAVKKAKEKAKAAAAKKKLLSKIPVNGTVSSELYAKCDKGKLVQSLLCRWWYCMEWPELEVLQLPVPDNCDPLKGFPGVYIYTSGENVGKILDKRNINTAPSFKNFAKKPSSELVEMLLKAIENQTRELIEYEGENTTTEAQLKDLTKWAMKLKCEKVDAEARKVLRVAKMELP